MRRCILVCFLLLAGTALAGAAELPLKAPPLIPFTWTGFFIGAHGGFGHGHTRFYDNFPVPDGELDADTRTNGGLFGLQVGYNYQIDWLVLGVGGDFSWSKINSNFSCFPFGDQVCSASADWIASITGRIGVTNGPWLFYVKGGPAWMRESITDLATCAGSQPRSRAGITAACNDPFYGNDTRFGWTVGPGIEYAFSPQWSAWLEYNYYDFGSKSVPLYDGGTGFFTEEIHQKLSVIRAGINYHFDWDTPSRSGPLGYASAAMPDRQAPNRVLAFTGADIAKDSYSGWVGGLIAPFKDLDTSGLRVYLMGEGGTYKYPVAGGSIRGIYSSGDALVGYGFEGDNYSINLLAGANAINHMLSDIDPENSVQGTAIGAKVRGDAWVNPTANTLSYGEAEYSTAFRTYYTKAKVGFDVSNGKQIFLGPEVAALGDERYNQWRVGVHLTQVKLGSVQIDLSAGYANDSIVGAGAYSHVELSKNF